MSCCKADEFKWCAELQADCQDEEGNKYCAFLAPVVVKEGAARRNSSPVCLKGLTRRYGMSPLVTYREMFSHGDSITANTTKIAILYLIRTRIFHFILGMRVL
jgi:hypothetical protein